jgi:hypothetical protein
MAQINFSTEPNWLSGFLPEGGCGQQQGENN